MTSLLALSSLFSHFHFHFILNAHFKFPDFNWLAFILYLDLILIVFTIAMAGSDGRPLVDIMQMAGEDPPVVGVKILCRHPFMENKRAYVTPSSVVPLLSKIWDGPKGGLQCAIKPLKDVSCTHPFISCFLPVCPSVRLMIRLSFSLPLSNSLCFSLSVPLSLSLSFPPYFFFYLRLETTAKLRSCRWGSTTLDRTTPPRTRYLCPRNCTNSFTSFGWLKHPSQIYRKTVLESLKLS